MRNIDKDVLIEIEILKNMIQAENLLFGWDHTWETAEDSRVLTGIVFSERDVDHFKSIVKRNYIGEAEKGICFGLTVESSTDWRIFLVRYISSTNTLSIDEYSLNPTDGSYIHENNIASWTYLSAVITSGMIIELRHDNLFIYDLDYSLIESYEFDITWEENIGGIYGDSFDVDYFVMYQLMKYGFPSARYVDYSLEWQINAGWKGMIELIQEKCIYWKVGSMVNLFLKPFRKSGIGDDYHDDLSLAFCGFVHDIEPLGFHEPNYKLNLRGFHERLNNKKGLIILSHFDDKQATYTMLNSTDILSHIYNEIFDTDTIAFGGSVMDDRAITINGSIGDVEQYILLDEGQHSIISPSEGGTKMNIYIYDDLSGEARFVEVGGAEENDIVLDFNLEEKIGLGHYLNQLKTETMLIDDGYRWICRANRYDRFVDQEILADIEENQRITEVPDLATLESRIEGRLDEMKLYYSGDITLAGNHHYLAGMVAQGKLTLTYAEKGITSEEFSIESMILNPTQTTFRITKSPRMERMDRIEQLRRDLLPRDISDMIRSLKLQRGEMWVDDKTDLWDDSSDILQIDIRDLYDVNLIEDIEFNESLFRGYKFLDFKIKGSGLKKDDESTFEHMVEDFSSMKLEDEPEGWRIYGGKFEVTDAEVSALGGTKSVLMETIDYGGTDEEAPSGERRFQWGGRNYHTPLWIDYWRENNNGVAGAGGPHEFQFKYKEQVVLSIRIQSDIYDGIKVYVNGNNLIGTIGGGCQTWYRYEFTSVDWDNYRADFEVRDMAGNVIYSQHSIDFVNNVDRIDRFCVDYNATSDISYLSIWGVGWIEYLFEGVGDITSSERNISKISVKTVNSDPNFIDVGVSDLIKSGLWILPNYYRIIFTDIKANSITLPGDLRDFVSRIGELEIWGTGGMDGTYQIEKYEYASSPQHTIVYLDEDIDQYMTGGYINTGLQTEIDLTIGIKKNAGATRGWTQSILF